MATGLEGNVEKTDGSMLKGGIKDDASLQPSLQVIPGRADKTKLPLPAGVKQDTLNGAADVTQFKGSVQYEHGQAVPTLNSQMPQPGSGQVHLLPPLSSFTTTSKNGIMTFAPEYQVTNTTFKGSNNLSVAGYSTTSPGSTSSHGIATFGSAYQIAPVSQKGYDVSASQVLFLSGQGTGIASAPGFDVFTATAHVNGSSTKGITGFSPGFEVSQSSSKDGVTTWVPGYDVSITAVAHHSDVTSSKGYQVCWSTPGLAKETLSGQYSSGGMPELKANQGKLVLPPVFVQPVIQPRTATALLLPGLQAKVTVSTWNDWYKYVGQSIYESWKCTDVGPGLAKVLVTVDADRHVACQVTDFVPALETRNVTAETDFREAAVRAVHALHSYDIPLFPSGSDDTSVSFEVDMRRTVDGPKGVDVAAPSP